MNQNKKLSTIMSLSKVFTVAMIAALGVTIGGSYIIANYINLTLVSNPESWKTIVLTATIVLCSIAAILSMVLVLKVLDNISKGNIYSESTTKLLSKIATAMFAICGICVVAGIIVWPTVIAIGFIGLYLGVIIKAVELCFVRANSMKDELDLTV